MINVAKCSYSLGIEDRCVQPKMIVATALGLILATNPRDRVELKLGGSKLSEKIFIDPRPSVHARPFKTLYFNGRKTAYTVPNYYKLNILARNKGGQLIGCVLYEVTQGEPTILTTAYGINFTTARGKIEELPFGPDCIDDTGRVFGQVIDEQVTPTVDNPHLWMWQRGKSTDLGLAYGWLLLQDGSVSGYYVTDETGKPIEPFQAYLMDFPKKSMRFRSFTWQNGKRTEAPTLTNKLPFEAHTSETWWDHNDG